MGIITLVLFLRYYQIKLKPYKTCIVVVQLYLSECLKGDTLKHGYQTYSLWAGSGPQRGTGPAAE